MHMNNVVTVSELTSNAVNHPIDDGVGDVVACKYAQDVSVCYIALMLPILIASATMGCPYSLLEGVV